VNLEDRFSLRIETSSEAWDHVSHRAEPWLHRGVAEILIVDVIVRW
jgi:hypothetical protein